MTLSLDDALTTNGYPGRGLLVFRDEDGWGVTYFLTGRSPASRDREVVARDGALCVQPTGADAFDPLRHYRAMVPTSRWCVVGNGEQVDTVATRLADMSPSEAAQSLEYEPDSLCTPRITVVVSRDGNGPAFVSRAYASRLQPEHTMIGCWTVPALAPGQGVLTTTYLSDGTAVTATDHAPIEVTFDPSSADDLAEHVWSLLPADLRVAALSVRAGSRDPAQAVILSR